MKNTRQRDAYETTGSSPGEFTTTDIWLTAFLMTRGLEVLRVTGLRGERRTFHFKPEARTTASEFYVTGGQVLARQFIAAYNDVRSLLRHAPSTM